MASFKDIGKLHEIIRLKNEPSVQFEICEIYECNENVKIKRELTEDEEEPNEERTKLLGETIFIKNESDSHLSDDDLEYKKKCGDIFIAKNDRYNFVYCCASCDQKRWNFQAIFEHIQEKIATCGNPNINIKQENNKEETLDKSHSKVSEIYINMGLEISFLCSYCCEQFNSIKSISEHTLKHLNSKRLAESSQNNENCIKIVSAESLATTVPQPTVRQEPRRVTYFPKSNFKCNFCQKFLCSKYYLRDHIKTKHSNEKITTNIPSNQENSKDLELLSKIVDSEMNQTNFTSKKNKSDVNIESTSESPSHLKNYSIKLNQNNEIIEPIDLISTEKLINSVSLRKPPKLQPKPKNHQLPIESDNSSDESSPAKLLEFLLKPLPPLLPSPLLDMSHINMPPKTPKPSKKSPNKSKKSLTENNNNENIEINSELQNFNTNNKGPIQDNLSLLAQLPESKQRYQCHICDKTLCNRYYLRDHLLRKHGIIESMREIKNYGKQNSLDSDNAVSEPKESEIVDSEEKTAKISNDYNENVNLEFLKVEVEDEEFYNSDLEMNEINEPIIEINEMDYNNISEEEESQKNQDLEISSPYNNMDQNEISNSEALYNQNTSFKQDDSIVNVSRFQCEKCLRSFNSIPFLKEHKRKYHQENFIIIPNNKKLQRHDCHICGKEFRQKGHLTVHLHFHYGIKRFACTEDGCDRRFVIRSDLNDHIRKCHTGERPYHCADCGKSFLTGSVFYQHRLIHRNDRRHECDVCGKKFYRNDALKNHKRIHSGEKPYKCSYCDKRFRQKGDLGKHTAHIHRFQIGLIDEAQKNSNKFNFIGSDRVHIVKVSKEDKIKKEKKQNSKVSTKEKKYGIVRNKEVVKKKIIKTNEIIEQNNLSLKINNQIVDSLSTSENKDFNKLETINPNASNSSGILIIDSKWKPKSPQNAILKTKSSTL